MKSGDSVNIPAVDELLLLALHFEEVYVQQKLVPGVGFRLLVITRRYEKGPRLVKNTALLKVLVNISLCLYHATNMFINLIARSNIFHRISFSLVSTPFKYRSAYICIRHIRI